MSKHETMKKILRSLERARRMAVLCAKPEMAERVDAFVRAEEAIVRRAVEPITTEPS